MTQELIALTITAGSLGFFHTLFGPDHYVPFIMMSVSRKWSLTKAAWLTILCGIGHISGSVVLGFMGVAFGLALKKLEIVESFRGDIAAWLLIAFGLAYFAWGMRRAYKNRPHVHAHEHAEDECHSHQHTHHHNHAHVHDKNGKVSLTPWVIFIIFVLGPCEPLIPLLMYPAAQTSIYGVAWVAGVFAAVTIGTMLAMVLIGTMGVNFLPLSRLERYTHALAGAAICCCGLAIVFLGL